MQLCDAADAQLEALFDVVKWKEKLEETA